MQKQLHCDGLWLFRDNTYQSYPWNSTASCWLDASLEALFFCYIHNCEIYDEVLSSKIHILSEVEQLQYHMTCRMQAYNVKETVADLQNELVSLRNEFAILASLSDLSKPANPLVTFI